MNTEMISFKNCLKIIMLSSTAIFQIIVEFH